MKVGLPITETTRDIWLFGGGLGSNFKLKPHLVALDVKCTRIFTDFYFIFKFCVNPMIIIGFSPRNL